MLARRRLAWKMTYRDPASRLTLAHGLVRALTDPALAATMAEEGKPALARLCCKTARDSAYEEIAAAVHAAGEARIKHRESFVTLAARTKSTRGSGR